ncbi:TPA: MbeB family mobilization protein [Enterobacter hormaechei subsp. xiangfangensis]|uniref:MbeB family mobilization protein n=2 Tax=Enterobacterales TaxID=91347 RepID=UPI000B1659D7|nr:MULTISPECIES: MbeB family mobilization protein [Enterobacteriaceae]MCU2854165.1 MbeB family mobilization protein [Enterobacter hormaechei subsp. hoffmannii]MCM7618026.1 MbeB family mobilization protein [Enterobacter hormaechei]MCW7769504.1 MbeB family mobilization protein [Enterobacter hormaechei]MCY0840916.1 MbeB family mobilization protein [Enterobacter cloacae complex sp. 2022EL-00759]MDH0064577.1 MbeB family mobilization protein [Leclercia adecarboxylata]
MSSLLTLAKDLEQKSKAQQLHTGEMLKAAFSEHEQSVRAELSASGKRISDAIRAHEESMSSAMEKNRRSVLRTAGRTWLTVLMTAGLLVGTSGSVLWWQGQQITDNYTAIRQQEDTLKKLTVRTWGVRYQESSDGRKFLILPPGMQSEAIPYDGTTWIRLKQE